ncbi:UNVERIFIED_ORG: two-component system OmpR family response regulator/two-component system response regulator QseB [Idiomarina abyssalis]|jgi:two-component system OmpR family response regulator/two-component system response regulator QseB|uniref:Response regulator (CheY, wHTH domains) n=2 Tax=Idiomarina TaxID=135575 RepID=Q5QUA5_IDILO|nr:MULTISPECIES: response regulator [Idiomarina]AAV82481.1 Response regulator (CheY, wHTH domains) [Idiomarina loihiensis L2TR]AGM36520.1 response regulator [Idiomarina loihiensis GSL 199]PWW36308.1 two-component system OmpR family response regulator/two-component system response regulator QseB [Idiomarina loihiensis]TDO53922.1 two-component system OmpR family response regulator/two-component system response regulator QseB [Idiomarina sp. 017G]TDP46634.1 two-component system OmpR family respon|tara:strand:+ start:2276 stop:2941 length:666 start_codon:yes stop_codon:yes gene_type:complete
MRLLLLEDDKTLAEGIIKGLNRMGYMVELAMNLSQAESALKTDQFELAIFDLGLPDGNAVSLIKKLRKAGQPVPIVVLTAWDDVDTKVLALNEGANDYVVKPFELRELEARVRVQVRKANLQLNDVINCGDLSVDIASQQCRFQRKLINLTRLEWILLKQLALHVGKIVSKEQLETACYGWDSDNESNSLEVHIHHLRKKLNPSLITTIRGLGYLLKDESS